MKNSYRYRLTEDQVRNLVDATFVEDNERLIAKGRDGEIMKLVTVEKDLDHPGYWFCRVGMFYKSGELNAGVDIFPSFFLFDDKNEQVVDYFTK